MATTTPLYAASPTALTVTNLHSLADGAWWQSDGQDNDTALGVKVRVFITILTTTSVGSADGYITVAIAGSVDGGTDYAGGASGTQGTYTVTGNSSSQLRVLGRVLINAVETSARTYKTEITIDDVPKNYAILIQNNTGAALGATVNAVEILTQKYTTA